MSDLKLTLPLKVVLPRKTKKDKNVYLNLNTYRNLHYIINNDVKKVFKEDLRENLEGIDLGDKINIHYTYYANSNRKSDVANMCVVVDKFLCDALSEYGCIPDDNYDHVPEVRYSYGGVEKGNGRVEVTINREDNL